MAYLFQQHMLSAAAFPGTKVAGAGSKEARMDSLVAKTMNMWLLKSVAHPKAIGM